MCAAPGKLGKPLTLLQVLHTRSCSGVGMHFLHFLAACYLVFSLERDSISAALASLPPLKTSVALQLGALLVTIFLLRTESLPWRASRFAIAHLCSHLQMVMGAPMGTLCRPRPHRPLPAAGSWARRSGATATTSSAFWPRQSWRSRRG